MCPRFPQPDIALKSWVQQSVKILEPVTNEQVQIETVKIGVRWKLTNRDLDSQYVCSIYLWYSDVKNILPQFFGEKYVNVDCIYFWRDVSVNPLDKYWY